MTGAISSPGTRMPRESMPTAVARTRAVTPVSITVVIFEESRLERFSSARSVGSAKLASGSTGLAEMGTFRAY